MIKTPKNKESTRYFSDIHEKSVCRELNAYQVSNSGAGHYRKGDCIQKEASLLIECKTCKDNKESFSIKEEWILKNREEIFSQHLSDSCIAFNFGPNKENFYVIDSKLMRFLVNCLKEIE